MQDLPGPLAEADEERPVEAEAFADRLDVLRRAWSPAMTTAGSPGAM